MLDPKKLFSDDQAAGLRRLLGGKEPLLVAVTSPRELSGRSQILAALARGLANQGKSVAVLDEHSGANGVAAAFGLVTRFDLMQAINRDVSLGKVVVEAESAIRIVPAARAARDSAQMDTLERHAVREWIRRMHKDADVVLMNVGASTTGGLSALMHAPQRVLVLISEGASAMTESYAQIKRLAQSHQCKQFSVLVTGTNDPEQASLVFERLQAVATEHLDVEIECVGCLALTRNAVEEAGQRLAEMLLVTPAKQSLSQYATHLATYPSPIANSAARQGRAVAVGSPV